MEYEKVRVDPECLYINMKDSIRGLYLANGDWWQPSTCEWTGPPLLHQIYGGRRVCGCLMRTDEHGG